MPFLYNETNLYSFLLYLLLLFIYLGIWWNLISQFVLYSFIVVLLFNFSIGYVYFFF